MQQEHPLVTLVYRAKGDGAKADALIRDYLPFIRNQVSKFLARPLLHEAEDEISIAMLAFFEAIQGYHKKKGAFLDYAALVIHNRLTDYKRKEARHHYISLDAATEDDGLPLAECLADPKDEAEELALQQATQQEIRELSNVMEKFGLTFEDAADNCPTQQRTLTACRKVFEYAAEHKEICQQLLKTRRLPLAKLTQATGVARKTLERHRKYLTVLLLIQTNGYELLRGKLYIKKKEGVRS